METAIILDWLNQLNETMKKMNRRLILCVDRATSHIVYWKLNNVYVNILPSHLTS